VQIRTQRGPWGGRRFVAGAGLEYLTLSGQTKEASVAFEDAGEILYGCHLEGAQRREDGRNVTGVLIDSSRGGTDDDRRLIRGGPRHAR
jgi:hypothetical protein